MINSFNIIPAGLVGYMRSIEINLDVSCVSVTNKNHQFKMLMICGYMKDQIVRLRGILLARRFIIVQNKN